MALPPLILLDKYALGWKGDFGDEGPIRPDKAGDPKKAIKYDLDSQGNPLCPIFPQIEVDAKVWTHQYPTDAHCVMYHVPGEPAIPRLTKQAVRDGVLSPVLGWIVIDVDTPDHCDLVDAPVEWLTALFEAEANTPEIAHALRWESKGGFKYAWPLAPSRQYPVEVGEDYLIQFIDYLVSQGIDVDEACKDWTRLMRMPNASREGDPQSGQYEVHGLDTLAPLDWVPPRTPEAHGTQKSVTRRRGTDKKDTTAVLLQRCREALVHVPATIDYAKWLNIGIALRTTFGEDGFDAWRAWSESAGEDADPVDVLREKWQTLPTERIDDGVTVRTIFAIAREHGWLEAMDTADALKIVEGAISYEDYFSDRVLQAAAALRAENGVGWSLTVERLKADSTAPRWRDYELKIADVQKAQELARKEAQAQAREAERLVRVAEQGAPISNFERQWIGGDEVRYRKDLRQILSEIRARTGGWPRMMDSLLFAPDPHAMEPVFFTDQRALFSWMELETGEVEWTDRELLIESGGAVRPVDVGRVFAGLSQTTPPEHTYQTVETRPHVPPVPSAYYFERELPEATGETLARFVGLFNAATPEDRQLLCAALYTGMWGGAPGKRPAFVITSDHGRGAGKTSTATAIARVYGGAIDIKASEGWGTLQQRLLDPSTASKRYCVIDNLKSHVSSAEFEAAITAPEINGKRMYVGDGVRANFLTWIFTANTPSLSNDLASRAVVIKVGAADHAVDFEAEIGDILNNHLDALLADIKAELEAPARGEIVHGYDRWQAWQRAILTRFENAEELALLIQERRGEVDDDEAIAGQWAEQIRILLRENGHDPETTKVVIPSEHIVQLARKVEESITIGFREAWDILRDVIGVGEMRCAKQHRGRPCRGLKWVGPSSDLHAPMEIFGEIEGADKNKTVPISRGKKNYLKK